MEEDAFAVIFSYQVVQFKMNVESSRSLLGPLRKNGALHDGAWPRISCRKRVRHETGCCSLRRL